MTQRMLDLVHLLTGGRGWSVPELMERFGVCERTVYRDFARLGEMYLPVVAEDGRYRLMEGARLRPLALTAEERAMLRLALGNPSLRTNALHAQRADLLDAKLSVLTPLDQEPPAALTGPERSGPISRKLLSSIETAIGEYRTSSVLYASLHSRSTRHRRLDPWRLLHRDGVWYLAGWCHDRRALRFFRADRILEINLSGNTFDPPEERNIDEVLAKSWSVYQGEALHEIVVHFAPEIAPLVQHGHHHDGEQIAPLPDGGIEYRVTLSHLDEIARWILGFGGAARAIAPQSLRERVRELAEGTLAVHAPRRGPKRAKEAPRKLEAPEPAQQA